MFSTEGQSDTETPASSLSDRALLDRLLEIETTIRRAHAEIIEVVGEIDARDLHETDGHRSVRNLLVAHTGWSAQRARTVARAAHVHTRLPEVAAALLAGDLSLDHHEQLRKAWNNPRVRDALAAQQTFLLDQARRLDADSYAKVVAHFVGCADPDGAQDRDDAHHARRHLRVDPTPDGAHHLVGRMAQLQGVAFTAVLDRFVEAETAADWATARDEHGDEATVSHLPRTLGQRTVDALSAMAEAAAEAPLEATAPDPVINVLIDHDALVAAVEAVADGRRAHLDPTRPHAACRTDRGVVLTPQNAAALALAGQVRRIVVDAASTIVDAGRARRFPDSVRRALKALHPHCCWPGCHTPSRFCHADHIEEHSRGGPSDAANASLLCGRHNSWRTAHGYRPRRHPDGTWSIHRPDGTAMPTGGSVR